VGLFETITFFVILSSDLNRCIKAGGQRVTGVRERKRAREREKERERERENFDLI
jgi:hypothetical protein